MVKSEKAKMAKYILSLGNFIIPSPQEVMDCSTHGCGWTACQLAKWGIDYPPPKGWRKVLKDKWLSKQHQVRH